jgi:hypothetical protein
MKLFEMLVLLSVPTAALADSPLIGTWKLQSYVREVLPGGERVSQFGDHPDGYLTYTADGRMHAILIMDKRAPPREVVPTDAEKSRLFASMVSYAGTFAVEGEKVVHHVDISWNQAWTGTDQVRFFKLDGDRLTITTAPARSPLDGKEGRSVLVWKKVKAPAAAASKP